jgi:hypothetical protein
MSFTTVPLESIGGLVRTVMNENGGGFLVAEFRDRGGLQHTEEAKANARLFVAAAALHEVAQQVVDSADINTPPALLRAAEAALAAVSA